MAKNFPLKFGDAGQYELSEDAFKHILWGDTAVRPIVTAAGRALETVLSGGLHTYEGWKKFVALYPSVVHLFQFRVGVHGSWWFARELGNGVITLKIPRRLFTGSAASITQQPDNYYRSGYLWKTLFPIKYSEDDIIKAISEALINIDQEESEPPTAEKPAGILYGYAFVDDPFAAIMIRIQVRGNQILSAFPAWDQPQSGNNGKPYSHLHSISFLVAESAVDATKFLEAYGPTNSNNGFDVNVLIENTPKFIRWRRRRNTGDPIGARHEARGRELLRYAQRCTRADLDAIDAYLSDYPCAKDPFGVQFRIYSQFGHELDGSTALFNAVQLTENIGECLWVLDHCDSIYGTRRAIEAIVRFLGMALVHTGGLNTLMFKALMGDMVTMAIEHVDPTALRDVLHALASSPCRAALYTEFDLSPYLKGEGAAKFDPDDPSDIELNVDQLMEFIAFNLGETYMLGFDKEQRLAFARASLDRGDQWRLAKDVMARLSARDFHFFVPRVLDLSRLTNQTPPNEDDLMDIARDYSRMMVMMRQRIVLEDPDAYQAKLEDFEEGTEAYVDLERRKNRRTLVKDCHEMMLMLAKLYGDKVGYAKLAGAAVAALQRLPKERIPLPKPIPDYIPSWRQKMDRDDPRLKKTIEDLFKLPNEGEA